MCSLWTILDNNLKCIPPTMCKITHPQQIQPTGAFYEWGGGGGGFFFFFILFNGVAWNQIYGNTSTSVSELLRKCFEIKQLSHCQTWYVKRGRRQPRRTGVKVKGRPGSHLGSADDAQRHSIGSNSAECIRAVWFGLRWRFGIMKNSPKPSCDFKILEHLFEKLHKLRSFAWTDPYF